jgi:hypothetical protein
VNRQLSEKFTRLTNVLWEALSQTHDKRMIRSVDGLRSFFLFLDRRFRRTGSRRSFLRSFFGRSYAGFRGFDLCVFFGVGGK